MQINREFEFDDCNQTKRWMASKLHWTQSNHKNGQNPIKSQTRVCVCIPFGFWSTYNMIRHALVQSATCNKIFTHFFCSFVLRHKQFSLVLSIRQQPFDFYRETSSICTMLSNVNTNRIWINLKHSAKYLSTKKAALSII